jgi:hypothetical protein
LKRRSILAVLCLCAASLAAGEGENLARGKSYTLSPRPDYRHCTDPGDATQLTDGVRTTGYFWTQETTVGWGRGRPAFITIDLGKVHPIGGASFRTAAGVAGVQWPAALMIFASDDGKQWFPAGDLVELSETGDPPPLGTFATHVFRTGKLAARGRYVQLACVPAGPYLFVDEIEVYAGDATLLAAPRQGKPIPSVPEFMDTLQLNHLLKAQLRRDLAAVRQDIANLDGKPRARHEKKAEALAGDIAKMPLASADGFRAVLPMTELERDIFRLQAAVWRAQGKPPLRIWKGHRWDPLAPSEEPPANAQSRELTIRLMRGETRADVLNLTSARQEAITVRLRIEGLPEGANADAVTVREVLHTGTRHFVAVAAALPVAERDGKDWVITVPSGMTRQVWISVRADGVEPGPHMGSIVVETGRGPNASVPLDLRVYPLTFPDRTTLLLGGWSYTNQERMYGVTPANRKAVVRLLREHHVNAPWATRRAMPSGEFDAEGNLAEPPDTANFDAWVKLWPGAQRYMVFAAVGNYSRVSSSFAGSEVGTPLFEKKVGNWIRFWADHLRELGLQPGQLGLLLVDEPHEKRQYDVTVAWTRAIKAAAPEVLVWVDPVPRELKTCREMLAAADVLVPNRPQWLGKDEAYHQLFLAQREAGRELGFYSCSGPARCFDPYAYYLLQQWHVFAVGGRWAGFWAFADTGGVNCWNEYVAGGNGPYCPLYLDATSATPAKYIEAIRESVQDYETLVMLRRRIREVERDHPDHPRLAEARTLLAGACDRVLTAENAAEFRWDAAKDRSIADQVRVEVLDMLVQLGAR